MLFSGIFHVLLLHLKSLKTLMAIWKNLASNAWMVPGWWSTMLKQVKVTTLYLSLDMNSLFVVPSLCHQWEPALRIIVSKCFCLSEDWTLSFIFLPETLGTLTTSTSHTHTQYPGAQAVKLLKVSQIRITVDIFISHCTAFASRLPPILSLFGNCDFGMVQPLTIKIHVAEIQHHLLPKASASSHLCDFQKLGGYMNKGRSHLNRQKPCCWLMSLLLRRTVSALIPARTPNLPMCTQPSCSH